jgi:hypothetical protein
MTLWLSSFSKITNVYVAYYLRKFLAISRGCGIHFLALCVGAELISAYCVTQPVYKAYDIVAVYFFITLNFSLFQNL